MARFENKFSSETVEWETPQDLFDYLCGKYGFFPSLDVCADRKNTKCSNWLGSDSPRQDDGLKGYWDSKNWCNPPHSETEKWVKSACHQFVNDGCETMMIIPANSMCTNYAESCIEPHAEYHPISRRFCRFLKDGKEADSSRNGYFVVIWRKIER